ncbi:glycosyl hydrolase [Streptomyces sp. NBC_00963]|uniref:glycoside hydrolase family 26 protein n=1 Tax=Streptomyces sp. NBC_00963 TaxID=2903697 RepID=UPI0038663404|nr:glycosyl hydrolase [Streptomyces sp. NBC_00963]
MPHSRRRLRGACIAGVATGLLLTGAGGAHGALKPPPPPAPSPSGSAPVAPKDAAPAAKDSVPTAPKGPLPAVPKDSVPAVGAYLDYGPEGIARMADLSHWLGGAELRVGHTYLPGDVWSNIEGQPDFLSPWAKWRRAKPDRMFVLNVPMQEHNEDNLSDDEVRDLIGQGARGDFDDHYRKLATRLVRLGVPDTVIVLGWEMNGTTYTQRCGPDPQGWKTYWNRIVTAMRSVPGQKFKFDFTPNRGPDDIPWTQCYPGDRTVDIVGMDSYDQPPGDTFEDQVKGPYGLQAQVDFATAHKKQISYPEWGLYRNGDDTDYMRGMLAWFDAHRPLYQTITDYCPHGVWQCDENPDASKIFRTAVSQETEQEPGTEPSTQPSTEPKPTGPEPTEPEPMGGKRWCVRIDLGKWANPWFKPRKICWTLPKD